jgi:hypothetical protein
MIFESLGGNCDEKIIQSRVRLFDRASDACQAARQMRRTCQEFLRVDACPL